MMKKGLLFALCFVFFAATPFTAVTVIAQETETLSGTVKKIFYPGNDLVIVVLPLGDPADDVSYEKHMLVVGDDTKKDRLLAIAMMAYVHGMIVDVYWSPDPSDPQIGEIVGIATVPTPQ